MPNPARRIGTTTRPWARAVPVVRLERGLNRVGPGRQIAGRFDDQESGQTLAREPGRGRFGPAVPQTGHRWFATG